MASESLRFWGFRIPPKETVELQFDDRDPNVFECFHVSNVALGPVGKAQAKPQCVYIKGDDLFAEEVVLGTLIPGSCHQFTVDFVVTEPVAFRTDGDIPVYLSGYKSLSMRGDPDDDDEDEFELTDEESDEDEEEKEEDALDAIAKGGLSNGKPTTAIKAPAAAQPGTGVSNGPGKPFPVPGVLSDDEEGDESDKLSDIELDDDDIIGRFVDEDEEGSEEDEDEEMEGDEDEDDEDEESSEEEEEPAPAHQQPSKKRAASQEPLAAEPKKPKAQAPSTPVAPPKKVVVKEATSAPAKVDVKKDKQTTPTAVDTGTYVKQVVDFIKSKGGTARMSAIGSGVKKPASVGKLKAFLEKSSAFKFDKDNVSLA